MKNPYQQFDEYGLHYLPSHLISSEQWDKLEELLTDLYFIEVKCAAGMTYDLIANYNATLDALPEAQEENRKKRKHEARVRKYVEDLIKYAKGEIQTLDIIPSVEPWSEEKIREDTERIINHPTRLDRIQVFSQFVNNTGSGLVKFGSLPGYCLQQAYNSASSGPVASKAESIIEGKKGTEGILLLQSSSHRPDFNPHPGLIQILEGHTSWVKSISITPDGKRAVSGSIDSTLRVWNLGNGECLRTMKGDEWGINSVSITSDGKQAVSGGGTLRMWDLEHGKCLRILEGYTDLIESVSLTPDGKRAVSGGADSILRVWELEHGKCLRILEGHTNVIKSVSLTPDGKRAVSGSDDSTLRIWDLERRQCLRILEGHPGEIESISITPDGKRAISGSWRTIRLWDLESGECLKTLKSPGLVNSVSITPDGKRAVSGSYKNLIIWDLESGKCLKILEGHTDLVFSIALTADGKRAVSGSWEKTIRVWEF